MLATVASYACAATWATNAGVHLPHVRRPRFERGHQRGVSVAEVVDEDTDPGPLDRVESLADEAVRVVEDIALLDLEREGAGVELVGLQDLRDVTEQPVGDEVVTDDVDRHPDGMVGKAGSPLGPLTERLVHDPVEHLGAELGAVHRVQELAGPHQPEVGMFPAEQGLDPTHRAVEHVDHGLVRQLQLPAGEGPLELAAEADSTQGVRCGASGAPRVSIRHDHHQPSEPPWRSPWTETSGADPPTLSDRDARKPPGVRPGCFGAGLGLRDRRLSGVPSPGSGRADAPARPAGQHRAPPPLAPAPSSRDGQGPGRASGEQA